MLISSRVSGRACITFVTNSSTRLFIEKLVMPSFLSSNVRKGSNICFVENRVLVDVINSTFLILLQMSPNEAMNLQRCKFPIKANGSPLMQPVMYFCLSKHGVSMPKCWMCRPPMRMSSLKSFDSIACNIVNCGLMLCAFISNFLICQKVLKEDFHAEETGIGIELADRFEIK